MGKLSRNKGRRGQAEFKSVLRERDWVIHEINSGESVEDLIATDPLGVTYSVEVKNRKLIDIATFKTQAMEQAKKSRKPWMLAVRVPGEKAWLVLRKGMKTVVW